jgi:hypothetical protein
MRLLGMVPGRRGSKLMARVLVTTFCAFFLVPPSFSLHHILPVAALVFAVTVNVAWIGLLGIWTLQISFLVPLAAVTSSHRWVGRICGYCCLSRPTRDETRRGSSTIRSSSCTGPRRRFSEITRLFCCREEPSVGQSRCRFDVQMAPIACHTSLHY